MRAWRIVSGITLACCAFSPVRADFVNGDFSSGDLTGWTLTLTENGATAVQLVELFDIDGPGPKTDSLAAKFSVGRASTTGAPSGGIELTQDLNLTGGTQYDINLDWAAVRTITTTNAEGGVFEIIVDGVTLASVAAGATSLTQPHYGSLGAQYTPAANGTYKVGVRITRPFLIPSPTSPNLFQYIDNASITGGSECKWDLNGDGKVCQEDLGELLAGFGTKYTQSDLGGLLAEYGTCGGPC